MNQAHFEELVMTAAAKPTAASLEKLLSEIRGGEGAISSETAGQLAILWESWDPDNLDLPAANFCVELAASAFPSSTEFRSMLSDAIRTLLPPYLAHSSFLRALGLRDDSTPLNEIIWRFRKLCALKNGTIVFRNSAWGVAGIPDNVNNSVPVTPYGGRGSSSAVPMEVLLKDAALLSPGPEMLRLTDPARAAALGGGEFRNLVKKRAVSSVSDTQLRQMALATAGKKLTPEEFEKWWTAEKAAPAAANGQRRSCDARSLTEMDLLIDKETAAKAGEFTADEVAAFTAFFSNLKPEVAVRESAMLAKVIAKLCNRTAVADRPAMFAPLREKAPFWPADPARIELAKLAVWGEIPAKDLEALALVTSTVFEETYLAECALRLPLKALNAVCDAVSDDILADTINSVKSCGADLLLWIWKNRKKHNSEELLSLVNVENVVRSLSQENLPKAWGPAQRELRLHLLEKSDFQNQLIASADNDAVVISSTLQGALFLSPGERQSLLVKLARHSTALRGHIESGAGQKILNAGLTAADKKIEAPAANEPFYTSQKSFERLQQELSDIINVHVPENREALKVARAHGDFRENAEFDAAKERRNFLSHRRTELERDLANSQPVPFHSVKVDGVAVIGCQVDLADETGKVETMYLLGAWDGNPDRNFLSYRTRLGQLIYGQSTGAKIAMPNGVERTIAAVKALPKDILAEME